MPRIGRKFKSRRNGIAQRERGRGSSLAGKRPKAEVIADFRKARPPAGHAARAEEILAMIRRHPVTRDEIAEGLGAHRAEVGKHLEALRVKGLIAGERRGGREYFRERK